MSTDEEIWRPFPRDPRFLVSTFGRVKHINKKPKIIKPRKNGWMFMTTTLNGVKRHYAIPHMVLETFIGPRPANCDASHLSGNPTNNRLDCLIWESHQDNCRRKQTYIAQTDFSLQRARVDFIHALQRIIKRGTKTLRIRNKRITTPEPPKHAKTHRAWINMRSRCLNPRNIGFAHYGGRGITVCGRWANDYNAFLSDMGEAPPGLSLERKNNELGYSPENCVWANITTQLNNQRRNVRIEFNGKTQTAAMWAAELNIGQDTFLYRRKHFNIEKTMTPGSLRKPPLIHGTSSGYGYHKCRCKKCSAFNAARRKKYTNAKKAKHGVET